MSKNLINAQVPEAELAKIQEKLREIRELLAPYVATLSMEDRKSMPIFCRKNVGIRQVEPKTRPPDDGSR